MEDNIKGRLSAYLRSKGINNSEFGRSIGVSNAYISSIRKSIQPDKVEKIANTFPDLNMKWLLTGEGNMLEEFTEHSVQSTQPTDNTSIFLQLLKDKDAKIAELSEQVGMLKQQVRTLQEELGKNASIAPHGSIAIVG